MFDAVEILSTRDVSGAQIGVSQGHHASLQSRVMQSQAKRVFDLVFSGSILLLISPLLLIIAALIKLDSKGPVFFRQKRTGLGGTVFNIYKFRSMIVMEDGQKVVQATQNDQRVTRLGAFLRRTSLDELPQLINIFQGDMSVVGPRPHALAHDILFQSLVSDYDRRFAAKPGLTGLAQVRGCRGEIKGVGHLVKRVELDLEYIVKWTLLGDIGLIMKTVPLVFGDKAAY